MAMARFTRHFRARHIADIYFRFIYATASETDEFGIGKYNCASHLMRAANNELGRSQAGRKNTRINRDKARKQTPITMDSRIDR